MRWMVFILATLPIAAMADGVIGGKAVDCYCTDSQGARVELGQYLCLTVGGRSFTAQCQMSLNVPMWREIQDGCVSSALPQSLQPAVNAGLVDPEV